MGELPFVAEMARAGFRLTENPDEIEYVVAAFDRTFDYRKFNIAFQAIKKGAHFIATNPDRTCPVEGGELPDCAGDHRRPGGDDPQKGGGDRGQALAHHRRRWPWR